MCATLSRNACQNRGPQWPCGLVSNPRSLGEAPPSPVSVTDSSAATSVCETLALLLVIALLSTSKTILRRPHEGAMKVCCAQLRPQPATSAGPPARGRGEVDAGDQFIDVPS